MADTLPCQGGMIQEIGGILSGYKNLASCEYHMVGASVICRISQRSPTLQ